MNIIIIGCGKIGSTLAEQLNNEGHDITIVDTNEKVVADLAMDLDVIGVSGNGAILDVQKEAGVEKADLLIATTGSDELNMLICLIAKKVGRCETIARIRNMEYDEEIDYLRNELDLASVINPERLCAHEITRLLRFPSAIEIESFSRGIAEMVKMKVQKDSPLIGTALKDFGHLGANVLVCMIERGTEMIIPSGLSVVEENDLISFIANPADALAFSKKCHSEMHTLRSAFIIGGGRITQYVLKGRMNAKSSMEFKVIDQNEAVCRKIAEEYPFVTVINGDGTNQDLMREEGIQNADAILTLTGLDEQNVMMSLIAHETSKARRITKVNHLSPEDIPEALDIGSLVCPKTVTANFVVRFVRAKENSKDSSITSLYKLSGGRAEAQEYLINEESDITGKPIKDLRIKPSVLIAAIIRKGKLVRPTGAESILKNDRIVIIASAEQNIRDLKDIFTE